MLIDIHTAAPDSAEIKIIGEDGAIIEMKLSGLAPDADDAEMLRFVAELADKHGGSLDGLMRAARAAAGVEDK